MRIDFTVGGVLIHKGKVLLIHHKKLNKWLHPGGHMEKNETPDAAILREVEEELKLNVEILNRNDIPKEGKEDIVEQLAVPFYINVHNVGDHNHLCFFYLLKMEDGRKTIMNKDELNDAKWFSPKQLYREDIQDDVRHITLKAFKLFDKLTN